MSGEESNVRVIVKTKEKEGEEEIKEIKELLNAISEFIAGLKKPLKEYLDMIMESLKGDKLGEDVASFYKKLKESGVPENLAADMAKEYLRKRLEAIPSLKGFFDAVQKSMKHGPKNIDIEEIKEKIEKKKRENKE